MRRLRTWSLALLPLAAGCIEAGPEPAPTAPEWPPGEGRIDLELSLYRSEPYVHGTVAGAFEVSTANGNARSVPFTWDTADPPAIDRGHGWTVEVVETLACDPDDGPLTITVEMGSWRPLVPDGAAPLPLLGSETKEIPCRAGFEDRLGFDGQVDDPRVWGQLRPRVRLDPGATGATGAWVAVWADDALHWDDVDVILLGADAGGALGAELPTRGCKNGATRTWNAEVLELEGPGPPALPEAGAVVTVEVDCAPGAIGTFDLPLTL